MKTLVITLLCSLLCLQSFSQSQTVPEKKLSKNFFYLSPFNLIAGQFQVGYEHDFGKRNGFLLLGGVIVNDNNYNYNDQNVDVGATAELQYRYHIISLNNPRGKSKNGFRFDFYAAPFAAYQFLSLTSEMVQEYDPNSGTYYYVEQADKVNGYSGGILFGTRFLFFERLSLDVYAGGGVKYSNHDVYYDYGILRPGYTGIIGKANLQLGVAF